MGLLPYAAVPLAEVRQFVGDAPPDEKEEPQASAPPPFAAPKKSACQVAFR